MYFTSFLALYNEKTSFFFMNAPYNPFYAFFKTIPQNLRRFSPLPPFYSFYPLYRPFSMHILIQTLHIITLSAHVGSTSVTERYRSEDTINYAALRQKMIVLRYTTSLFPSFSQSETAISLFAELSPLPARSPCNHFLSCTFFPRFALRFLCFPSAPCRFSSSPASDAFSRRAFYVCYVF